MLAGIFLPAAMSSLGSSVTITNSGVINTTSVLNYTANAVWIQDAAWSYFPTSKRNILSTNLTGLVSDCANNDIEFAFVFVGYWNATNPSAPTVGYQHSDTFYANVISAFHAVNIKVFAWVETDEPPVGTMDITASNRQNIYNAIIACMNIGFDGYNDDIESYTGTHQDYLDYLNNATVVLHNIGKLMAADVDYDYQQNTNPYLHLDFIVTMFYGSSSLFDPSNPYSSECAAYWQENFGVGAYAGLHPASPLILGIQNSPSNTYPLSWQLAQCQSNMTAYGHPQLVGFSLWLYETMGAVNADDWAQWHNWIMNLE
jgi:hypothetical protein